MNDIDLAEQLQIPRETIERWRSQGARIPQDPADASQLTELARWVGEREERATRASCQFPQAVLNFGFVGAIVLAGLLFLGTVLYLGIFLLSASSSITDLVREVNADRIPADSMPTVIAAQMMVVKMTLLSCGIFVGAAVGFLGFSLLLLGFRGSIDTDSSRDGWQAKLGEPGARRLHPPLCRDPGWDLHTGDLSLATDLSAPSGTEADGAGGEEIREQIAVSMEPAAEQFPPQHSEGEGQGGDGGG